MDWEIATLSRKVNKNRRKPDIKPEVEEWVNKQLVDILADLEQLREEMGFEHFLVNEIQKAAEGFKDPEKERDEPLCECENSECPLKNGRLPLTIRKAPTLGEGILEYRQEHGNPVVLNEAQEKWRKKKATVQSRLSQVLVTLQRNTLPAEADGSEAQEAAKP